MRPQNSERNSFLKWKKLNLVFDPFEIWKTPKDLNQIILNDSLLNNVISENNDLGTNYLLQHLSKHKFTISVIKQCLCQASLISHRMKYKSFCKTEFILSGCF